MDTKERIILKSVELFKKAGIRQVTMDQIAAALGMSKRTIYEMFKDKDELLWQCLLFMDRQNEDEMEAIISQSSNAIEALYLIGQHGEKKKADINPLFFDDFEKLYPEMRSYFVKRNQPGNESITYAILKRGIKEGIFRKELNLAVVDVFIHEMMQTCHKTGIFPDNTNTRVIIDNIIIPYFRGISTKKGLELIEKHFPFEQMYK
ncbi:MAG: TetR/AcrR family transcriptional regulator [Bacteroidales bacterium]|nr:TetR/AcrR family transcriptional regulator [Bacteroidales bacterium]